MWKNSESSLPNYKTKSEKIFVLSKTHFEFHESIFFSKERLIALDCFLKNRIPEPREKNLHIFKIKIRNLVGKNSKLISKKEKEIKSSLFNLGLDFFNLRWNFFLLILPPKRYFFILNEHIFQKKGEKTLQILKKHLVRIFHLNDPKMTCIFFFYFWKIVIENFLARNERLKVIVSIPKRRITSKKKVKLFSHLLSFSHILK